MNQLTDAAYVRKLLESYGFNFSKALGQNFLINPSVCPKMAELSGAGKGVGAIEIGPGVGVLTAELAERAEKVVAIELDSRLIPVLRRTLKDYDNIRLINGDALETDLKEIVTNDFAGLEAVVCANLPYYITSPVIMHLLESKLPVNSITVMVQKEAGRRICAVPGSREAGAVSLAVRYYSEPAILFDVSSGSFMPRPKVDSCVIRLDVRSSPPVDVKNEKLLFRIIRAAFNQRRKTLLNGLSAGLGQSKEQTAAALERAGIACSERGEKLTLGDFASIANVWSEMNL